VYSSRDINNTEDTIKTNFDLRFHSLALSVDVKDRTHDQINIMSYKQGRQIVIDEFFQRGGLVLCVGLVV